MKNLIVLLFLITCVAGKEVSLGIDEFLNNANYLKLVENKRVALVTTPASVNKDYKSSIDLLAKKINLTCLFALEHGIRGDKDAGEHIKDSIDPKTNLPVYSTYKANSKSPDKKVLDKFDVIIYDIQDVGSRSYTFIWSLAKLMQSAQLYNKTVIVLDRPCPFGANTIDGAVVEDKFKSFIGLYNIPNIYGLTVGELSWLLKDHFKLNCKLYVIKMNNYHRGKNWEQTKRKWISTSPNIPSSTSAYTFAMTGALGSLKSDIHIGVGTQLPFQIVSSPWLNAEHFTQVMNLQKLPGVCFIPWHGKKKNIMYHGIQIIVKEPNKSLPSTTALAILWYLKKYYPNKFSLAKNDSFDKAFGSDKVRKYLNLNMHYSKINQLLHQDRIKFLNIRNKYLLY